MVVPFYPKQKKKERETGKERKEEREKKNGPYTIGKLLLFLCRGLCPRSSAAEVYKDKVGVKG